MSEHTPDASNGMTDGQEPSMEDILASIRKIIADDDAVAQENTLASQEAVGLSQDILSNDFAAEAIEETGVVAELNAFENSPVETLDLDIVSEESVVLDSEIDQLLSTTESIESEGLQLEGHDIGLPEAENEFDDILDLEIPMEEDESISTELEGLVDETPETAEVLEATLEVDESAEDDDLALMLDDMLGVDETELASDIQSEDLSVIEEALPSEELTDETELSDDYDDGIEELLIDSDDEGASIEEDADMNLVKSLMADLTEEPLHEDEIEEATALEADLVSDIPDIDSHVEDDVDDVMDEILTMTLEDEVQLQDAIEIPEIDEAVETLVSGEMQSATSSLLDIAAEAEADASAIEGGNTSDISKGVLAGAAAMAVASVSTEAEETDDVDQALAELDELIESDNLNPTPETEMSQEETPDMPRAVKKDTIIDEVTESATAGAFASLNQVVEEKAVVAERGDRVGDLVMEALRPMLKEWLDANLKGIVERAVTKEVKRISSGK